jgi:L-rhamnose mutarotase
MEYLQEKDFNKFKRFCKVLKLKDDPQLIEEYKKVHATGAFWPEISEGMKKIGIVDMEIYIHGRQLFMIMETTPDFNHDEKIQQLARLPRQKEWEAFVSRFQETASSASAEEKWQPMERIFKMDSY